MVTVGQPALQTVVFDAFEALRTFDADAATANLADDAVVQAPWLEAPLAGREAIQDRLAALLGDTVARPSFSLVDASGDGSITKLTLSVSGRFGAAPRRVIARVLVVRGKIHQILLQ